MDGIRRVVSGGLIIVVSARCTGAQHLRWDDNEMVRQAVIEAERRLEKHSCARLFGKDASLALRHANYRFIPMGTPELRANGTFQLTNAITIREIPLIVLNADGAFANPGLRVGNRRLITV